MQVYDRAYFKRRRWLAPRVERLARWFEAEFGPFRSSLDLGAGCGDWSRHLADIGTDAWAVDRSEDAIALMPGNLRKLKCNLRRPFYLGRAFDLVICVEVAEHLPESAADTLCQTIIRHCGKLALFTAAPRGQGGTGHINCQPKSYWKAKLVPLVYLPAETARTKAAWKKMVGAKLWYLPRNLMLFEAP